MVRWEPESAWGAEGCAVVVRCEAMVCILRRRRLKVASVRVRPCGLMYVCANLWVLATVRQGLDTHSLPDPDRKSTRLNSSHVASSYAVFCLKRKRYHVFLIT